MKELLDKTLTPKTIVSTVPRKNMIMDLPYLGKLSLQICTRTSGIMKNSLIAGFGMLFSVKLVTFLS